MRLMYNDGSNENDKIWNESEDSLRDDHDHLTPKYKGWKIPRHHLQEGTLLLNTNGEYDAFHRRSRQEIVNEFHDGMHFSIRSCWSAIF